MRETPRLDVMNGPFSRRLEGEMNDTPSTDEAQEGHENPGETPVANPVGKPPATTEARHAGAHTRVLAGRVASRPENTKARL